MARAGGKSSGRGAGVRWGQGRGAGARAGARWGREQGRGQRGGSLYRYMTQGLGFGTESCNHFLKCPSPRTSFSALTCPAPSPQVEEDPTQVGLVLEWVYGCIVSTAEKARDAAQRCLSLEAPSTERAWGCLRGALRQQREWALLAARAQELAGEARAVEERVQAGCVRHGADLSAVEALCRRSTRPEQRQLPQQRKADSAESPGWLPPRPARPVDTSSSTPSSSPSAPSAPLEWDCCLSTPQASWVCDGLLLAVLEREAVLGRAEAHLLACAVAMSARDLQDLNTKLAMVGVWGGGGGGGGHPVPLFPVRACFTTELLHFKLCS